MNFKFKISNFKLLFVALLGIAISSCSMLGGGSEPEYRVSDLQGLWLEDNTQHYVRFTTEQSDEAGYMYGREWDEKDDVMEEDLTPYGNGWFKYLLEKGGQLNELHLMDNNGAEIPKIYVVTKLTDTNLSYYEKDHPAITFDFQKVVSTK